MTYDGRREAALAPAMAAADAAALFGRMCLHASTRAEGRDADDAPAEVARLFLPDARTGRGKARPTPEERRDADGKRTEAAVARLRRGGGSAAAAARDSGVSEAGKALWGDGGGVWGAEPRFVAAARLIDYGAVARGAAPSAWLQPCT